MADLIRINLPYWQAGTGNGSGQGLRKCSGTPGRSGQGTTGDNYREMELDAGMHAVMLHLAGEPARETTMDGRQNSDAIAWVARHHGPVSLSDGALASGGWGWIVKRDA